MESRCGTAQTATPPEAPSSELGVYVIGYQ
jgi:hypothetical protein